MRTINGTGTRWLRRYHQATDAAVRLVCFPHVGGSAPWYQPLSAELAPSVDVLSVQYPGRLERRADPCIDDLGRLADEVCEVLRDRTDLPLALFGHSMGGTLAFEVVRRLEAALDVAPLDVAPLALFVSGRRAPSIPSGTDLHGLGDAGILAEIHRLGGTDRELLENQDFLDLIMPAIRADYTAIETYRCPPGAAVGCPVVVLYGDRDPQTTAAHARAWREHTTGPLDLHVFPGDHFYPREQWPAVADLVRARLTALVP